MDFQFYFFHFFFQHRSHSQSFENGADLGELDYYPWAIKINLSRKQSVWLRETQQYGRNFRAALSLWTRENFLSAWYSLSDSGWPLWCASDCRVEGVGYFVPTDWDIDTTTKNWRCLDHKSPMELPLIHANCRSFNRRLVLVNVAMFVDMAPNHIPEGGGGYIQQSW